MALAVIPVIGVLLGHIAHTRIGALDDIGSGADHGAGIILAAIGLNHQVVIGHQERQVRIRLVQFHDKVTAFRPHRLDAAHHTQCTRFRILARMTIHRGDNVLGSHFLAVGERDALTNPERPHAGVGGSFPALGNAAIKPSARRQFHQRFTPKPCHRPHGGVGRQRRIKAVGRAAALHANLDRPAFFRTGGLHGTGQHGIGGNRAQTQRAGPAQEIPACQTPHRSPAAQIFQFIIHCCSPVGHLVFPMLRSSRITNQGKT